MGSGLRGYFLVAIGVHTLLEGIGHVEVADGHAAVDMEPLVSALLVEDPHASGGRLLRVDQPSEPLTLVLPQFSKHQVPLSPPVHENGRHRRSKGLNCPSLLA